MQKLVTCVVLLHVLSFCDTSIEIDEEHSFFYFAYGSNLLRNRMRINCPSALFYSIAKLEGWRLDFNITVGRWNGAAATICEDPDFTVWGDLWMISLKELPHLDKQEGVHLGWYYATNVTTTTPSGKNIIARVYIEHNCPKYVKVLPSNRQPSKTYLDVIYLGAKESGLPKKYLNYILSFQNNGKLATLKQRIKLGFPFINMSALSSNTDTSSENCTENSKLTH